MPQYGALLAVLLTGLCRATVAHGTVVLLINAQAKRTPVVVMRVKKLKTLYRSEIMKRKMKITVMLATILVAGSTSTNAEIVFDNGEPTIYSGGDDIRGWVQADDFVSAKDIFLTGSHFWTLEEDNQIWDGTLEYFIFADNDGMPGPVISSGDGQSVQKNATGRVTPSATEYEYSFEFDTSVSLVANETYWFGLHLDTGYPIDFDYWFSWSTSLSGLGGTSFESEGGTLDNWSDTVIHRAFYLEGIPEPSTILLLGVGGLVLARKIRQRP